MDKLPLKNHRIAFILAFFLGGIGAHLFYLQKRKRGAMYLLFSWTGIPILLGWLDILSISSWVKSFNNKHFPTLTTQIETQVTLPSYDVSSTLQANSITNVADGKEYLLKEEIFENNEKETLCEVTVEYEESTKKDHEPRILHKENKQLIAKLSNSIQNTEKIKTKQQQEKQLGEKEQFNAELPQSKSYSERIKREYLQKKEKREKTQLITQISYLLQWIKERKEEQEKYLREKEQFIAELSQSNSYSERIKREYQQKKEKREKTQLITQISYLLQGIKERKEEQEKQLGEKEQFIAKLLPQSKSYSERIKREDIWKEPLKRKKEGLPKDTVAKKTNVENHVDRSEAEGGYLIEIIKDKEIDTVAEIDLELPESLKFKNSSTAIDVPIPFKVPLLEDATIGNEAKNKKSENSNLDQVSIEKWDSFFTHLYKEKFYEEKTIILEEYSHLKRTNTLNNDVALMQSSFFLDDVSHIKESKKTFHFARDSMEFQHNHNSPRRYNQYFRKYNYPTFEDLNGQRRNWYFRWREESLKLNYLDTDLPYIYLFLYELSNYSFNINPGFNVSMMVRLFEQYKVKYPSLRKVVPELVSHMLLEIEEYDLAHMWLRQGSNNWFSHDFFLELSVKDDWSDVAMSKWNRINKGNDKKTPFFSSHKQQIYKNYKNGLRFLHDYYREQNVSVLKNWFKRTKYQETVELFSSLKPVLFRDSPNTKVIFDEYIITEVMATQVTALFQYAENLVKFQLDKGRKKNHELLEEQMDGSLSPDFLKSWLHKMFGLPEPLMTVKDIQTNEQKKVNKENKQLPFYDEKHLILPDYNFLKTPNHIKKHVQKMHNSLKTGDWDVFLYVENYYISSSTVNFIKNSLSYANKKGDNKGNHVSFYWSSFGQMNTQQKKWYFHWREEVLNQRFPDTDLSYIFAFVYELINYSFNPKLSFNISMMIRLFDKYKGRHVELHRYLPNWIGHMLLEANEIEAGKRWLGDPNGNKFYVEFKNKLMQEKDWSRLSITVWNRSLLLTPEKSHFFNENRNKIYSLFKIGMGLLQEYYQKENISILDDWFELKENKVVIDLFSRAGNILPREISSLLVDYEKLVPSDMMRSQVTNMYYHAENLMKKEKGNNDIVPLPKDVLPPGLLEAWRQTQVLAGENNRSRFKKVKSFTRITGTNIPERPSHFISSPEVEGKQSNHSHEITFNDENIQRIEKENDVLLNHFAQYEEQTMKTVNRPSIDEKLFDKTKEALEIWKSRAEKKDVPENTPTVIIEFNEENISRLEKDNNTLIEHFEQNDDQFVNQNVERIISVEALGFNEHKYNEKLNSVVSPNLEDDYSKFFSVLKEEERYLLTCFSSSSLPATFAKEVMKKKGKMLNAVIQGINEKAVEFLGDILLETEYDNISIFEEYIEIVNMIKSDKVTKKPVDSEERELFHSKPNPISNLYPQLEGDFPELIEALELHERYLLTLFRNDSLSVEVAKQSLKEKGKMVNVVIQSINEKAVEILGDNLIEQTSKEFVIYDEYIDVLSVLKENN